VGYGGVLGGISNMTEDGFAPCAFHSFPSSLKNDGINGDYGSGFYGYAMNTATYIMNNKKFGWLAFGGNSTVKDDWVNVDVTTASKQNIFIAPAGLWINFTAGQVQSVAYNTSTKAIRLTLAAKDAYTPTAYFKVEQTALQAAGKYLAKNNIIGERGMYAVTLNDTVTTVELEVNGK